MALILTGNSGSTTLDSSAGLTFSDSSNQQYAASPYVLKNRLINGSFAIDQRNAGASQTFTAAAAIAYTVDRWYGSCTGANITGQRVSGTSPNQYAYKFTGAASNTGTLFGQRIESYNCYDLISTTVTGSVKLSSSSITSVTWTAYYANTTDTFSSKTQIATGTLTITSTPTVYSFSFNAGANAGNGIAIEFTTGALTATNTIQYENAQLELGTSATPFERRLYNQELANCQRYYQTYTQPPLRGVVINTTALSRIGMVLPVVMRTAPTAVVGALPVWDGNTTTTISSILASYFSAQTAEFDVNVASALTNGRPAIVYQAGSSSMTLSAEL